MQLKKVKNPSVVQQVIDSLTDAMIRKELRPGDKIPTENELSESLGVARNSVREAIKILVFLGVLEIRRPEGTFVCDGFSESMINPMIYGIILNQGDSWDSLMELREMTEAGVIRLAIEKETQEDLDRLKSALAAMKEAFFRVPQDLQASFEADNHFHDTIMEMGRNVMVSKINNIVRILTESVRYETVSGMITSGRAGELYEAHERIYRKLCEKAREYDFWLLEDDPYGEIYFGERPPVSLRAIAPERTIRMSSMSKVLAPGFRLGYIVAPKHVIDALIEMKQSVDLHTSTFTQLITAEVLKGGLMENHMPGTRALYAEQAKAMLDALEEFMPKHPELTWTKPTGGMFIWVTFPKEIDAAELMKKVLASDVPVGYVPGFAFYATEARHNEARLSFVTVPVDKIRAGVESIAKALKAELGL